jgi:Mn2+/Fe2+ NRAMP family transporter
MKPQQLLSVALGIVTSMGGFLEAGSIATSAQAGATFGYQLLWPIALGTIVLICLIEMAGRLAAVGQHPLPSAVRERFGFNYFLVPLIAESLVDFLVLTSEIGGAAYGLQLLTGIHFTWWVIPVVLFCWLLLWNGNFGVVEYGVSTLGLATLVFVVAAIKLHPNWSEVSRGLIPSLPDTKPANYWFLVVSILGATISPFLMNFYSSGAVEDEWSEKDLMPNRLTAILGMGFGGTISMAVLIAAAGVLGPQQSDAQTYEQISQITSQPLGVWGFRLFGFSLFIACSGAAMEISLDSGYVFAQCFGWNWGENKSPDKAPRFSLVYTGFLILAGLVAVIGMNPIKLTMFSMAVTTLIMPLIVLPFIVVMNDKHYVGEHRNGHFGNAIVIFAIVMASVLAVVAIPLQIMGGS